MRSLKKMLLGSVAALAFVAVLAVGSASAATPAPPPPPSGVVPTQGRNTMDANVPYLAWAGEHVRLVACDAGVTFGDANTVQWLLVDPPGGAPDFMPQVSTPTIQFIGGCAVATWISDKPGTALIKLIVYSGARDVFEKVFIVGWMELLKPTVTPVGGTDVNAGDFCQYQNPLDAPTGIEESDGPFANCAHTVTDPRHRLQIIVKGNLPLESDFSKWGLGDHLTLPDDWGRWAAAAASTTSESDPLKAMSNWDIHDDSLLTEGHVITGNTQCPVGDALTGEIYTAFDSVDNCTGDGPAGSFSTVFGTRSTAGATIGPFDPVYPFETMLSDGKVDAGDAPMPAAQIDVTIADNTLAATDISGVGYLYPSYKTEVYSRDGLGSQSDVNGTLNPVLAHNFFAPFYSQYIPATSRPGALPPSGIDGSGDPDGFGGFLVSGEYRNWSIAHYNQRAANADSKCLFSRTLGDDTFVDTYRPLPYGYNSVSVYTDESGEANVNFVPGLGMYFDNLSAANKNLNNGCDLENVDPIGTASVQVVAKYPYQPVTARPTYADPVKFTVHNLFKKTLTVYSKGVDKNGITSNSVAKIVLAHAQDIDGSPLAYELVCWMADSNAAGFRVFAGDLPAPTKDDPNAVIHLDAGNIDDTFKDPFGIGRLCTFTDIWGNAAIEVFNSNKTKVDVIAEFVNEGILRDTVADFGAASLGQAPGTTSADGPPTAHVPTPATLQTAVAVGASGPVLAAKPAITTIKSKQAKLRKKFLHKIRFAKVVTPFHKKAKLIVRVNGKAGMVGLRITILKGGKSHTFTRFVPANHKMTVKRLNIPNQAAKVTVKIIGL